MHGDQQPELMTNLLSDMHLNRITFLEGRGYKLPVDPNSKYRQRQINQNPVTNLCLLICFAKRYFDSPATSLFNPIIMLSLFISNLSEEDEVFCFAYSYTQPTVQLYITPLIAFIFDEFTFFEATP